MTHQALSRIEIELGKHGGEDNGKLPVTYKQFAEYGIHRDAIGPALSELEALGFIEITPRWASAANFKRINWFRLTYRPAEGVPSDGSHEWRQIKTLEEAVAKAKQARKTRRNPNAKPNAKNYFQPPESGGDAAHGFRGRYPLNPLNPLGQSSGGKCAPTPIIPPVSTDSTLNGKKDGPPPDSGGPSISRVGWAVGGGGGRTSATISEPTDGTTSIKPINGARPGVRAVRASARRGDLDQASP